jgi:hypothetical protein
MNSTTESESASAPDVRQSKAKRATPKKAKPATKKTARAKKQASRSNADRANKKGEVIAMMKRAHGPRDATQLADVIPAGEASNIRIGEQYPTTTRHLLGRHVQKMAIRRPYPPHTLNCPSKERPRGGQWELSLCRRTMRTSLISPRREPDHGCPATREKSDSSLPADFTVVVLCPVVSLLRV